MAWVKLVNLTLFQPKTSMFGWWPSVSAISATLLTKAMASLKFLNLNLLTNLPSSSSQPVTMGIYLVISSGFIGSTPPSQGTQCF